jgi:SP family xylose:H+ symportor-like MFS transporter
MAAAVAAQLLANLLVSWSFKVLDGNAAHTDHFHHGFAYWLYGAMNLAAIVFVVRFAPETNGATLESVSQLCSNTRQPEAS